MIRMLKFGMTQAKQPFSRYAFYAAALTGVSLLAFNVARASESMLWADIPEISVENGAVIYAEPSSSVRTLIQSDLAARAPTPPSRTSAPASPITSTTPANNSGLVPTSSVFTSQSVTTETVVEVPVSASAPAMMPAASVLPAMPAVPRAATSHLAGLIRNGLARSPSMAYSLENQNLMRALYDEQVASTGPQVSAYGNVTGDYDTSSQKSSRFTNTVRAETGLRTNYTLYNFGVSEHRTQASQRNVERAGAQMAEQKQATAFEIAGTYLELIRQREMLALEHYRMQEHQHFLNVMETAYASGQVQISQVYLARTGITQREQARLNAERQLYQVKIALERVSGAIDVNAAQIPPVPALNLSSEGTFIDAALAHSPLLDAHKSALKSAELEIAAAQSSRYGSVNVNLDVSADRVLRSGHHAEASTTAALEYAAPLYTHGGSDARVAAARARKALAEAELDNAVQMLREQLQEAFYTLRHAEEIERLAMREAQEGEQILNAFKGEIVYGTRPYSDISAQIDSIAAARGRAVSARISKVLAAYAVLRFQNQLAEHFQ